MMPHSWKLPSPSAAVDLPIHAVHVWRASLVVSAREVKRLRDVLSPDERERARRFRFPSDQDAFIAGRGRLRLLLGSYLGIAPEAIAFTYGPFGKPTVASGQDLRFNLSHAGAHLLIGVTRGREIGVDLEPIRALPDADEIAERFFSPTEVSGYMSLSPEARPEAFFRIWTQKESIVKALGDGLTHPLDTFDVAATPEAPVGLLALRGGNPRDWSIKAMRLAPEVLGAVAATVPPWTLTCWDGDRFLCLLSSRRHMDASAA